MSRILYIQSSPRKERSHSIKVADEYVNALKIKQPKTEVETLNIWEMALPAFDGDMLEAKYAVIRGENPTPDQAAAWTEVQKLFDQFNAADSYVISVPMWNFSVPYRLKQYIDVITQPGMAWSYSPEESYKGLLQNKSAVLVYSSGDCYGEGTGFEAFDLQKSYVNLWLNFVGITDIRTINVEGTLFPDKNSEEIAKAEAVKMAGA